MAEDAKKPAVVDRVVAQALTVRPSRVLLVLLMLPFYVVGFTVGAVWFALRWTYSAVQIGFIDATTRLSDKGSR